MIICNTFFRKSGTGLITYTSGPSKTQTDLIMVRNDDGKRVGDITVIAGKEVAQQYQLLICNIMISAVKEVCTKKRKV